jgi:hypothetical protein
MGQLPVIGRWFPGQDNLLQYFHYISSNRAMAHGLRFWGVFFFGFAEWLAEGNRLRCFDYQGLFDPDLLRSSGEI